MCNNHVQNAMDEIRGVSGSIIHNILYGRNFIIAFPVDLLHKSWHIYQRAYSHQIFTLPYGGSKEIAYVQRIKYR